MKSNPLDLATRRWWRLVGRRVDLGGRESWLAAPMSSGPVVGTSWVGSPGTPQPGDDPDAGLLADFDALAGPRFDPGIVDAAIRSFYGHTGQWAIDVWSQWSPLFQPAGALVAALFSRRVQQLALPVQPLAVSRGMESTVIPLLSADGRQEAAAWVRTLRATGETVFSGRYAVAHLPDDPQPMVHVAFPLENGNLQVYLEPRNHGSGGFSLVSGRGAFGQPGAYVVVAHARGHSAARVPIHERFDLYVDEQGVLRTDHRLQMGRATALRLHYRMAR